MQNIETAETPLVIVLLSLLISGKFKDKQEAKARINALGLAEYVRVSREVQKLQAALLDYGEKWKNAEYWGYGVDYPTVTEPKKPQVRAARNGVGKASSATSGAPRSRPERNI
jgi:hypothetical protein